MIDILPGYSNRDIFLKFLQEVVVKHATKKRPLVIIVDNHESHYSIKIIIFCQKEQVFIFWVD